MKRDMKLIRHILKYAEEHAEGRLIEPFECSTYSEAEVHYHVGLCVEAGFLTASKSTAGDGFQRWHIVALTWTGHEKLDQLNSEAQLF